MRRHTVGCSVLAVCLGLLVLQANADDGKPAKPNFIGKIALPAKPEAPAASAPSAPAAPVIANKESVAQQVRDAVEKVNSAPPVPSPARKGKNSKTKPAAAPPKMVLTIEAEPRKGTAIGSPPPPPDVAAAYARAHGGLPNPVDSKAATRAAAMASVRRTAPASASPVATTAATAAAAAPVLHTQNQVPTSSVSMHGPEAQWSYEGVNGPQAWPQLKPEFNICAQGTRQSPIDIQDNATLRGPAEPLQIHYQPSGAMVVNTGRTIQVDVVGDNTVTVRGGIYKLTQIVFHNPSEERINGKPFAMSVHLVHRDEDGQIAVVAVMLEPGQANALINKVWTYMPLDTGDRVRMPPALLDINELLPKDMRYYQFMGSLTAPPCSEGVLWLVLKQPQQLSPEQLRLFNQLYPFNARPVQPLNGRVVRNAE